MRTISDVQEDWAKLRSHIYERCIFTEDMDRAAKRSLGHQTIGMFFRLVGIL